MHMKIISTLTLFLLALAGLISFSCNQPQTSENQKKAELTESKPKVLFVLTSHSQLGNTGEETGFYLSEASHPWKVLTENGIDVDFVTIQGGMPPVDGFKLDDPVNKEFWEDPEIQSALANAPSPGEIDPADYDAIHFVGGHGTMWDFPQNDEIASVAARIYEDGGYVTAVCHGPAALVNIRLSDGSYLVEGKKVTAFTNGEEIAVELDDVVPFMLQDSLESTGAQFVAAENWTDNVQVDGRLITGQNPQSAESLGEKLAKRLKR